MYSSFANDAVASQQPPLHSGQFSGNSLGLYSRDDDSIRNIQSSQNRGLGSKEHTEQKTFPDQGNMQLQQLESALLRLSKVEQTVEAHISHGTEHKISLLEESSQNLRKMVRRCLCYLDINST